MRKDGYHEMCQWVNAHDHGSMKDFDAGLQIVDAYIHEQYDRMKLLRNEEKLYDLLMERIDLLELVRAKVTPVIPDNPLWGSSIDMSTVHTDVNAVRKVEFIVKESADLPINPPPITRQQSTGISALEDENKLAMKEQAAIHAQLYQIGRDRNNKAIPLSNAMKAKRAPLAAQLIELEHRIRKNWHDIDHLKIYGNLPEVAAPVVIDDYQKKENNNKMIRALRMSIPKLEQKIATLSGAKLDKALKTLDAQKINYRTRTGTEWQTKA